MRRVSPSRLAGGKTRRSRRMTFCAVAQQPFALTQGFAHQPELAGFQIAQPAVDQLAGTAGGAGG
jgi:hypothetical protein